MARKQSKATGAKKKVKDLQPKSRAKGVKGGAPKTIGDHANRLVNRDVGRTTDRVGDVINDTGKAVNEVGKAVNRALNPR